MLLRSSTTPERSSVLTHRSTKSDANIEARRTKDGRAKGVHDNGAICCSAAAGLEVRT